MRLSARSGSTCATSIGARSYCSKSRTLALSNWPTLTRRQPISGARLGLLGFVVTRNPPSDAVIRKMYSVYNDSPVMPRKVILVISDPDMRQMIEDRMAGRPATPYIQALYRSFRSRAQ